MVSIQINSIEIQDNLVSIKKRTKQFPSKMQKVDKFHVSHLEKYRSANDSNVFCSEMLFEHWHHRALWVCMSAMCIAIYPLGQCHLKFSKASQDMVWSSTCLWTPQDAARSGTGDSFALSCH